MLDFRDPVSAWTHLIWMILALPGTVLLWQHCRGDRAKQATMVVFGLSLVACFGSSALFHALRLPRTELHPFVTLDYIGIYLLIAGTSTPIVFTLIRDDWRWTVLAALWLAALLGSACRVLDVPLPPVVSTALYLMMGWGLIWCYPTLARALSHRDLRLLLAGGLFYSLGAVAYTVDWPVLWPGVVGSHEMLHFCDMAGSLCHFGFMLWYVVPFERTAAVPDLSTGLGTLAVEQSVS